MNYIEKSKSQASEIILKAYEKAVSEGTLSAGETKPCIVEIPKDTKNGDYSTSFALQNSKILGSNPRKIAEELVKNISLENTYFKEVTIAGAGFINFSLENTFYADVLKNVLEEKDNYGRSYTQNEKIMIEFVSANPTGPMHMGNARGGVLGDCLAEVLAWAGNSVEREFLINDAGNQVNKFADSIMARYIQHTTGSGEFPEDGYHGDDIRVLAEAFYETYKNELEGKSDEELRSMMVTFGLERNIAKMKSDLARYKISYDTWFSETILHETGYIKETVEMLTKAGKTYEKDDAIWLRSTDFGCEKDDVLMRGNGFYTYFAADIAYHRNKFEERKFDRVINIWGADHHGHVARLKSALDAIGLDGTNRLEIVLMQLVRLMRNGEVARMSKRTGKSITLSDLLDEIPVDAARFFFNSRQSDTHLEFDLDLAVKSDSDNPVYYVSYAHARCASIIRKLAADSIFLADTSTIDFTLLTGEEEINLIKAIANFPEEIVVAAAERDPSKINKYLFMLATQFHKFYNSSNIRDAEDNVKQARLALCHSAKQTIVNAFNVIGGEAPDQM